jgi:hypothetical protein
MAYNLTYGWSNIGNSTGGVTNTISVNDNTLGSIAGISLPGKNYLGYGQAVDQTILNITEHWTSSPNGPSNPVMGQIWFDVGATGPALKYYSETNTWNEILVAGTPVPSANFGNIASPNASITGGNVTGLTNLSSATANIATGNIANLISANAAITGGNVTGLTNLSAANIAGGNISGNISGTSFYKTTFNNAGTGAASPSTYDASANVTVSWNTLGAAKGNATGWATSLVGPVANISITGGTAGQALTTDGAGTLTWSSIGGGAVTTTALTTGATATAGTITGQWTLAPGSTLNATYADLAERHHSDAEYPVGTVMTVGGANEVTSCKVSQLALGVVSDQYAYLMNADAGPDETHPAVGYLGRVPVRVVGPITKHQRVAPAGDGVATAADKNSFGWALESNNEVGEKLVLCLIK